MIYNLLNYRGVIINKEATAVQASSKKESKMDLKGSSKSMDIKIENFDIAFGDKYVWMYTI